MAFAAWSGLVLLGIAVASHVGALTLSPVAPLAAGLAALGVGTLVRLAATAGDERGNASDAALMPALVKNSTAAILTFDCDGRIRSCNRALLEMFGYAADDLLGTSFGHLLEVPSAINRGCSAW